jgi:Tol biopolymer transport system component
MKIILALIALTLSVPQQIDLFDEQPPPISFTTYRADREEYYVYDFASGRTVTIPRRNGAGANTNMGEYVPPEEMNVRVPDEIDAEFVLVNQDPENYYHTRYSLYEVEADGDRRFILDNTSMWIYPGNWSPNRRYLYVIQQPTEDDPRDLLQYDVVTEEVTVIAADIHRYYSCRPLSALCLIYIKGDEANTLYLFDRDTGNMREFVRAAGLDIPISWPQGESELIYQIDGEETTKLYLYNIESDDSRFLVEAPSLSPWGILRSPNGRWLAMQYSFERRLGEHIYVFDLADPFAPEIQLTRNFESLHTAAQHTYQWVGDDTLAFDASTDGEDGGLYTMNVLQNEPNFVMDAGDGWMIDQDWSPDGKWLAYINRHGDNGYQLFVVPVDGHAPPRQVEVDLPENVACVGWFDYEIYASGTAYICDKHWGMG